MKKRKPDLTETANFIADYAIELIAVGSYSARVHRCVNRLAKAWGYEITISILLANVTISLIDPDNYDNRRTFVKNIKHQPVNLRKLSDLGSLSWEVNDYGLSLKDAKRLFYIIKKEKSSNFYYSLFLTSIAFGAFCKLFGGDLWGMFFVILGTFCGVVLKHLLTFKFKMDNRIIYILCAFLSSYVAYLGCTSGLSATSTEVLSSSILYLVPGIVLINAIFDILNQNTLIGISRLVNVTILFVCMAIGIYLTLSIVGMEINS